MRRATTMLATAVLTLAGSAGTWATATSSNAAPAKAATKATTIVIGNEGFEEDNLVAQMYADVLAHAGFKTEVRSTTGRPEVIKALAAGQVDVEPDYAGSLLVFLKPKDTSQATRVSTDLPALRAALAADKATALNPSTALDTNVFVVTKQTASKYHLSTLSSLAPAAGKLTFGAPPECPTYYYCIPGLKSVYGIKFGHFVQTDEAGPIAVGDLKNGKVQVVELFSSNGDLLQNPDFVALTDNKHLEPADYMIPVVRKAVDTPALSGALNKMDAKLTTAQLEKLNVEAADDHQPIATVATNWLKQQGLG